MDVTDCDFVWIRPFKRHLWPLPDTLPVGATIFAPFLVIYFPPHFRQPIIVFTQIHFPPVPTYGLIWVVPFGFSFLGPLLQRSHWLTTI